MKSKQINNISALINRIFRIFIRLIFFLLAASALLIILLYIPPIQSYLAKKAENTFSNKINNEVHIGALNLNLFGNLILKDIYIKDSAENKVLQADKIDLEVSLLPLLYKKIHVGHFIISGFKTNLEIDTDASTSNLDFIINVFSSDQLNKNNESNNWEISMNEVSVEKSFVSLKVLRILHLEVDVGRLELLIDNTDLKNLDFKVDNIELHNTEVSLDIKNDTLHQSASENLSTNIEDAQLDNVISEVGQIDVYGLRLHLNVYDKFNMDTHIPEFSGNNILFNLKEHLVNSSSLQLINSKTSMSFLEDTITSLSGPLSESSIRIPFIQKFMWNISSRETDFQNCEVRFDNHSIPDTIEILNANHFDFKNINFSIREALLAKQHLTANIKVFSFKEDKGFDLQELNGGLFFSEDSLAIDNIKVKTANSSIKASASAHGIDLNKVFANSGEIDFHLYVDEFQISSKDIKFLMSNNFLTDRHIDKINLTALAEGRLEDFHLNNFEFTIDDNISGKLNGQIRNILNPDLICFNPLNTQIHIKTQALSEIFNTWKNEGINFPEELNFTAEIDGCLNELKTKVQMQSSFGDLVLSSDYKKPGSDASDSLYVMLQGIGLDLGRISQLDGIGKIDFRNETIITGLTAGGKSLKINMVVDTVYVNYRVLHNINFIASYDEGNIDMVLESNDSLINLYTDIKGQIKDSIITLNTNLNLKNIDLGYLGVVENPVKISAQVHSEETLGKDLINTSGLITDLNIISENTYSFDSIHFYLYKNGDSTSFNIKSDFIRGYFISDIPINKLGNRIVDFYKYHFTKDDTTYESENSGYLNFSLESEKSLENLIMLVPGLDELRFSKLEGEINELQKTSRMVISIPRITYKNITYDSISLNMLSQLAYLNYDFNIHKIYYQNYNLQNLTLSGQTEFGSVNNVLLLTDTFNTILLRSEFNLDRIENDQLALKLAPDSLIINSKLWSMKGENEITIDKEKKIYGKINISDGLQSLLIVASDTLYEIDIVNFQLANLSRLLQNFNQNMDLSGGFNIQTYVQLKNEDIKVSSNISLADLIYQNTHFGNIEIKLENESDKSIVGELNLMNGNNNLQLTGIYNFIGNNPFKADVKIQFNEISEFQSFGNNLISDPKGKIIGEMAITGDKDRLTTNGTLNLESIEILLTSVNNNYKIENEEMSIKNNKLIFEDFTLLDPANNNFRINGYVQASQFDQFNMDLAMKADRFAIYNVSQSQNQDLYGKLIVSMDAAIKGTLNNPNISLELSIDNGTNMTYALPPKNFDLEDSDGIVEFVNFSEMDSVQGVGFQQYIGDTIFSKLNWIDLNAVVTIDKSAQFMIDMDPFSGDYIRFGGTGNLNLVVQKNQAPQITGNYLFDRGIYEVSFYGLVKKSFVFQPGSIITWSGDPYNAQLNLKANYNIRTASIGLVSREVYGLSDEEKSKYRRALPYSVEIKINGQLDKPVVGFGIDLPEEEKSGFPLVDAKLNRLNEPGNESELTRQVFGLLTIGSFMPETTGPGGGTDYGSALATTAAANSLNSILTNELNKLSGKYIRFADLDVGMQTFSDMSGGMQTNRTTMDIRLSKKLFNERVTIEAQGSFDLHNEADKYKNISDQSAVQSDFAIIYDLRENGDYKLKAFERSAWDIIYKDTRIGGVAIIFIKEFDKYKQDRKSNR